MDEAQNLLLDVLKESRIDPIFITRIEDSLSKSTRLTVEGNVLENPQRSTDTPPGHTPTDSLSRLDSNSATMTLETNGK